MVNIIELKVSGQFLTKNNKNAGTIGSGNSTEIRLQFDNSWAGFAKRIIWRDAKGENETSVLLVPEISQGTNVYKTFVPVEATACAGWCSMTIEGYYDSEPSKAIKTISDKLYVSFAETTALGEPTPTEVMQLHSEFENLMPKVEAFLNSTTDGIENLEKNISRWENYNEDSLYYPGNKVTYNGCCYVCVNEACGINPQNENYWMMIAQKGEQGQRGMQGPQGVRGEKGDCGEKGERGDKGERGEKGADGERGAGGVIVPSNGFYSFDVDENGDLWVNYPDKNEAPAFELNENGELILTVEGIGDKSYNIGKVKGDTFSYDDFTEENKNDLLKDTATKEELEKCFKFETGYEDEIDSYVGLLGKGKWYEINPPKDEFVISWETYYIFAMLSNSGEILQVKFFENNKGFYFRTGRKADAFSSPQWGEWSKTVLSNEIESVVEENSTKLITSGGVYAAIGDIETSLENIIAKYGLGGEA